MIFLHLFITFFKIGLFTFGGGASMIPLIQQEAIGNGWLTMDQINNYIAISESTPGPIAINMATFVGSSQGFLEWGNVWGRLLGAFCATAGVVLPSFIIILLIAAFFKKFAENKVVKTLLTAVRPVVVGLILAAGLYIALSAIGVQSFSAWDFNWVNLALTAVLALMMLLYKKIFKKGVPVILFIVIAACVGVLTNVII
jgi:chromate transporter